MTKRIVIGIVVGVIYIVLLALIFGLSSNAHANFHSPFPSPVCDNGEHVHNPHCSQKPSASPSFSPTATPSNNPCGVDHGELAYWKEVDPCPSFQPTPTPEPNFNPCVRYEFDQDVPCPTASPEPTTGPGNDNTLVNDTTQAPAAPVCDKIQSAPTVISFSRNNPGSIHISWSPSDEFVHDFVIQYGLTAIPMWNTIVHIEPGQKMETDLNLLPLNHMIWVRVAGTENGCVGSFGNWIDP